MGISFNVMCRMVEAASFNLPRTRDTDNEILSEHTASSLMGRRPYNHNGDDLVPLSYDNGDYNKKPKSNKRICSLCKEKEYSHGLLKECVPYLTSDPYKSEVFKEYSSPRSQCLCQIYHSRLHCWILLNLPENFLGDLDGFLCGSTTWVLGVLYF